MELFHVDMPAEDLISRPGPLVVAHEAAELAGVLVAGEEIVVTDRDGEFHAAVVLSVDSTQGEPVYAVRIGARLPADMAAQRLTDVDMVAHDQGLYEVADLLGDVRRSQQL